MLLNNEFVNQLLIAGLLLFLSFIGAVVLVLGNIYRKRSERLPYIFLSIYFGSLALIGFPFLSGFYSKDLILEISFSRYSYIGYLSYYLGILAAFFTAFYSTRLLCLTFICLPAGHKRLIESTNENSILIPFVLGVLPFPSIFISFYCKDMFVGFGTTFFGTSFFSLYCNINIFDSEFISTFYKILPTCLNILAAILAFILYTFNSRLLFHIKTSSNIGRKIYIFFNRKWFFDKLYVEYFGQFFFKFGYSISYKFADRGIFEVLGPRGLSITFLNLASNFYKLQTNYLYHYTFSILVSITFLFLLREIWVISSNICIIDFRLFIFFGVIVFF